MSTISAPHDPKYTALVGKAVYLFAYYEWIVVYLIQQFEPGFVEQYCRKEVMASGKVNGKLQAILENPKIAYTSVTKEELKACSIEFDRLIDKRNALIHAHPITDLDGSQILNYQGKPDRPLPDMKWPAAEVETAILEFDKAACSAKVLLDRLSK